MKLVKYQSVLSYVDEFIRERISSGDFPPNSKLPATAALAELTGTSVGLVHEALAKLSNEGLLDRRRGRGTFVRGGKSVLHTAGLYLSNPLADPFLFFRAVGDDVIRKLRKKGVNLRLWVDERGEFEQDTPPAALKRVLQKREIQALIAPLAFDQTIGWMRNSGVPYAFLCGSVIPNGVTGDVGDLAKQGLEELKRQGCRQVAYISHSLFKPSQEQQARFAEEMGLKLCEPLPPLKPPTDLARFGYAQFHALWDQDERPDGLLVYPDTTVTGVITAILERRVNVPADLKVVFSANDTLPYICPFPASFLVNRTGDFADALVDLIYAQMEGEAPAPKLIFPTLVRDGSPFPGLEEAGATGPVSPS